MRASAAATQHDPVLPLLHRCVNANCDNTANQGITRNMIVALHGQQARANQFYRGFKVKNQVLSNYHVTWYVDFHPTPWNRADCQCSI